MEVGEGEEGTELVDGYSERGRGVLDNKWYNGTGDWLGSATTSNSYITILKDKKKDRSRRPPSKGERSEETEVGA